MMKNSEVARIFNEIADLLEIKGENRFRIRAYRKAAQNIENLTENIEELAKKDTLENIPGIGKDLANKIKEFLSTGSMGYHEELKAEIPPAIITLMSVPGVGPKTAKLLYEKLHIDSIEKLEKMARDHRIRGLPGLKEKTEENILKGIEFLKSGKERHPLGIALGVANEIVSSLKELKEVDRISPAGSLRRRKETIRDIDILVTAKGSKQVIMDRFVNLPVVKDVLAKGDTKGSVRITEGIQVDLRIVEPDSYGSALAYFTGSKEHNIRLREIAKTKGLKINEYGIFREKDGKKLGGKEEQDIYSILELPYIPPEIREDTGEIEAAMEGKLPDLVELSDIKGDFHVHSKWSDGMHSIEEVAKECKNRGYEYVIISDHSKSLGVAGGLSEDDLLKQLKEIEALNKRLDNFRILAGIEVDIRSDGTLDFSDDILSRLDVVIAAIHSGFKQGKDALTKRIISAMKNRYVNIIAHPTGRLIGVREGYELDLEEIFKVARDTNTSIEINSYPQRLDLNDKNSRWAKEEGVKIAIGTDAHTLSQLDTIELGVAVARRGWLEKRDVLNCLSVDELLKKISKR